jgi:membrane-associated HD superfamily phosphohydrolase
MTIQEMIKKYRIRKAVRNGVLGILIPNTVKLNSKTVAMLKENKPAILAELERTEEEERQARERELEEKRQAKQRIIDGTDKIELFYSEGEYLSGYMPKGEASGPLEKLGVAHYVSGWGVLVDRKLVEALGTEFSYQQVLDYLDPVQEETEKKQAEATKKKEAEKAEKFQQAKETGEPVEIHRYTADCNDPSEECNLDIVTIYAMPDGSTKTVRNHTW